MRDGGFEALADGVLLLVVLLVAATMVLALGRAPEDGTRDIGVRTAEATRLALFRTTLDGLSYRFGGETVPIPDGTTVESLLRLEAHLLRVERDAYDFSAANSRVLTIASQLLGPGWSLSVVGDDPEGGELFRLPEVEIPVAHYASGWTYPSLAGGPERTRLTVAVWLSPLR